jgi:hypothetical protein
VLNLITIPNGKKVTKSNQKSILEMMPKSSEKDVEHNCSVLKNLFQCAYIDKNSYNITKMLSLNLQITGPRPGLENQQIQILVIGLIRTLLKPTI